LKVAVIETNSAEHRPIRHSLQASGDGVTARLPAREQFFFIVSGHLYQLLALSTSLL
jgi:hypothetical protein